MALELLPLHFSLASCRQVQNSSILGRIPVISFSKAPPGVQPSKASGLCSGGSAPLPQELPRSWPSPCSASVQFLSPHSPSLIPIPGGDRSIPGILCPAHWDTSPGARTLLEQPPELTVVSGFIFQALNPIPVRGRELWQIISFITLLSTDTQSPLGTRNHSLFKVPLIYGNKLLLLTHRMANNLQYKSWYPWNLVEMVIYVLCGFHLFMDVFWLALLFEGIFWE